MAHLPILMYHAVSNSDNSTGLTISKDKLEEQFAFLQAQNYKSFHFSEFNTIKRLPKKAIVITFDDVYVNQLEFAYPLLEKYQLKATFFIPFNYVGGVDSWNSGSEKIMSVEQLKSLDTTIVELGLHSYYHKRYNELTEHEIAKDLKECRKFIDSHQLTITNALAYPYGKYPREKTAKNTFFKLLRNHQITYGVRIGNRINRFPFKNNYEIQRIDIKGEDSLLKFRLKLKFGKLKLF